MPRLIIDAHLDLAWNALSWNRDLTRPLDEVCGCENGMTDHRARGRCAVTLPEMRRGGVAVCLATILVRTKPHVRPAEGFRRRDLDVATQEIACAWGRGQLEYYRLLEERGEIVIIKTAAQLREHWSRWEKTPPEKWPELPVGVIVAMEGADPIVSPAQTRRWFDDGLRAVGLAHYGASQYAVGTGDAGPLTDAGVELLREMRRCGMILDLTHSSDPSFFQAIEQFDGPVIASHNNCRALVPGDRQFSDEQIRLIIARGGVIGAALDGWMLQPGFVTGQSDGHGIPLSAVVDHIDHVCQLAGNTNHAAIGSDLDGGFGTEQTPAGIDSIADLQNLEPPLRQRGYGDGDIDNIFHGNWVRLLMSALPK